MNTKSHLVVASNEAPHEVAESNKIFTDSYRRQLTLFNEATDVLLRSAKAIQEIQQRAAHQAAERCKIVAKKSDAGENPANLMLAQARFWTIDQDLLNAYWRDMAAALLQAQSDLSNCVASLMKEQSGSPLKSVVDSWKDLLRTSFNIEASAAS